MALIGKIREKSWLLITFIGIGLGGFIFMDMFSGQTSIFGSDQNTVGTFNGEKLDWNRFARTEQLLYGNSGGEVYSRRNALWNYFIEETLVQEESEALGLGVSEEEMNTLQFGDNARLSPIIQQRFADPNTRQVNREQLNNIKSQLDNNQMDPNLQAYWTHQEKEIVNERLKAKITGLATKALYTPNWMAEMIHAEQSQKADLAVVKIPFDEIDNADVPGLEDSDYQNYLNENKEKYMQDEETRKIEYATFTINASPQDSASYQKELADNMENLRSKSGVDLERFVSSQFGVLDKAYVKKEALSTSVADTIFGLPVGEVYGPYVDAGEYKIVKVMDKKVIPDSVRSRHILIRVDNPAQLAQATKTVDSLKTLIETQGAVFDTLALAFGSDGTATKGGDLDWAAPGRMVKPFNDLIFFEAEPGELHTVTTQFGVHLVEVTDKKFVNNNEGVQVAYVTKAIEPSEETQNAELRRVLELVSENPRLSDLATTVSGIDDVELEVSAPLKRNDFVVGQLGANNASRDIIRWAFRDGSVGEVSQDVYTYDTPLRYVVAGLKSIQSEGLPSVANIKEEIEQDVLNRKKAQMIKDKISGQDLAAIASSFNTQVDTAQNVALNTGFIPNLGSEPKVVAKAFQMDANQVTEPITGNNGVYIVKVLSKPAPAAAPTNLQAIKSTASSNLRGQLSFQIFQDLKKKAEIEDNRSRFY